MGPELLIPALLSGGGTLLQMSAAQDQAGQKRRLLNQQLERDAAVTKQGQGLIQQQAELYDPTTRAASMKSKEDMALNGINLDIGENQGNFGTTGSASSEDFIKTKAARAISEGGRLSAMAREIAKTRAPGLMQLGEGQSAANLGSELNSIFGTNRNLARATQNDADNVEMPWYGALGSLASGIGSATMGGGFGGGKKLLPGGVGAVPY